MRTLDEVRARCEVEEITGCWVWTGARSSDIPRIYAPDLYATEQRLNAALAIAFQSPRPRAKIIAALVQAMDPVMEAQTGRRATWQMAHGKGVKDGLIVYNTCRNEQCVNPSHARCGTGAEWGRFTTKTGKHKGQLARILANRRIALARTTVKPEHVQEILLSPETGLAIGARLGYSRTIVSKYRAGHPVAHRPVGSLFVGLAP